MPSSSVYATPIVIDLRPGFWERGILLVATLAALLSLFSAQLPIAVVLPSIIVVFLIATREWMHSNRRPHTMHLYADGTIELSELNKPIAQPASLLQSSVFLGFFQLHFEGVTGSKFACMLFPDRITADLRHRLRLWLALHRPNPALVGAGA